MPIAFDWSATLTQTSGNPVPSNWLNTKGKGVKVAFIDTGVNLGLPCLSGAVANNRRFFTGNPAFSAARLTASDLVQDNFQPAGHGTKYFSLLAGRVPGARTEEDQILGLAPDAEYYVIKARDGADVTTKIRNILGAYELAGALGADIAICGLSLSKTKITTERNMNINEVNRVFSLPAVRKMFIFNALENRQTGAPWDAIADQMFPNMRPEVFNVARMPNDWQNLLPVIKPQHIDYLVAGFQGWNVMTKGGGAEAMIDSDSPEAKTNLGSFKVFSNSASVAIMGGIATLALSFFKAQNRNASPDRAQMVTLLNSICKPLSPAQCTLNTPTFFTNISPASV